MDTTSPAVTSGVPETQRPTVKSPETTAPAETSAPETTAPEVKAPAKSTPAVTTAPAKTDKPASMAVRYFVQPVIGAVGKAYEMDIPVYSMTMNDYRGFCRKPYPASSGEQLLLLLPLSTQ